MQRLQALTLVSRRYHLRPLLVLELMSITSHLVKPSLPNIFMVKIGLGAVCGDFQTINLLRCSVLNKIRSGLLCKMVWSNVI